MNNCKNCNSELNGDYCSNCGHAAKPKRIDSHYIIAEIKNLFYLEKGFFYTIRELLIKPGQSVREYISADRHKLVKPITFLLLTSLIYTLINYFFHIDEDYTNEIIGENAAGIKLYQWIQGNFGYLNLVMGVFIAFWVKIFFKKSGYNFFEILVLLCFLMGIEMLISSFFGIIEGITKLHLLYATSMIGFTYKVWATGQFFANKPINYLKALAASLSGLLTFFIIETMIATIIIRNMQV